MVESKKTYMAVRRTDSREWLDISTWGQLISDVRRKIVIKENELTPSYTKVNPVVRIVVVEIKEL